MAERKKFNINAEGLIKMTAGSGYFLIGCVALFLGYDLIPGDDLFDKVEQLGDGYVSSATNAGYTVSHDGMETATITVNQELIERQQTQLVLGSMTMALGTGSMLYGSDVVKKGLNRMKN